MKKVIAGLGMTLGLVAGCKKDAPAEETAPTSSAAAAIGSAAAPRLSRSARIDPQTLKEYRVEVCAFGSVILKQARDAYLGSVGGGVPSVAKPPVFFKQPKTPAAPEAAAPKGHPVRPMQASRRMPYERHARTCTVAMNLKEPAMEGVDAAVAAFGPFAVGLGKDIATIDAYFAGDAKKDQGAQAKTLHEKLTASFGRLDDLHGALFAAVNTWRASHPADPKDHSPGRKLGSTVYEHARALMTELISKTPDKGKLKSGWASYEASVVALQEHAKANANDPWPTIMLKALDQWQGKAKELAESGKALTTDELFDLVPSFTQVIEARHRALAKELAQKAQEELKEKGAVPEGHNADDGHGH